MGNNNKVFTENVEINSLALAHHGAHVGVIIAGYLQKSNFLSHGG